MCVWSMLVCMRWCRYVAGHLAFFFLFFLASTLRLHIKARYPHAFQSFFLSLPLLSLLLSGWVSVSSHSLNFHFTLNWRRNSKWSTPFGSPNGMTAWRSSLIGKLRFNEAFFLICPFSQIGLSTYLGTPFHRWGWRKQVTSMGWMDRCKWSEKRERGRCGRGRGRGREWELLSDEVSCAIVWCKCVTRMTDQKSDR